MLVQVTKVIRSSESNSEEINMKIQLEDIKIRTELKPGDIGYVIYLRGYLYKKEYNYGIEFETYVASGLAEFYEQYDKQKDRVWVCEHEDKITGFLLLMHRGDLAQLRYFILEPAYRGIGLGNKLLSLYMDFLKEKNYKSSYLLTTDELPASAHLYKNLDSGLQRRNFQMHLESRWCSNVMIWYLNREPSVVSAYNPTKKNSFDLRFI
jgi:peptidyl-dipeptidase Dcp